MSAIMQETARFDGLADVVGRLEIVLAAEEEAYRRFKQVLRREEQELVALDPIDLERTTAEKQALAAEARLHGESRVELTQPLAARLGVAEKVGRLGELLPLLGERAGALPDHHARLTALIEATRGLLAANERFANRSLGRIQDTLRLLGQAVPEPSGYGPGKDAARGNGRGRLIRAAI